MQHSFCLPMKRKNILNWPKWKLFKMPSYQHGDSSTWACWTLWFTWVVSDWWMKWIPSGLGRRLSCCSPAARNTRTTTQQELCVHLAQLQSSFRVPPAHEGARYNMKLLILWSGVWLETWNCPTGVKSGHQLFQRRAHFAPRYEQASRLWDRAS